MTMIITYDKSTFLKLLLGIYKPMKGRIDFYHCKKETGDAMTYVPSDNYIFSGTIQENICMTDTPDIDRLNRVAEMAENTDKGIGKSNTF